MFPVCLSNSSHSSDFAGARIGEEKKKKSAVYDECRKHTAGTGSRCSVFPYWLESQRNLVMCHSW